MTDDLRGAAAAGMLSGILAGWKRDANPGALDDMTETRALYDGDSAAVVLTFEDGDVFRLSCTCLNMADEQSSEALDAGSEPAEGGGAVSASEGS